MSDGDWYQRDFTGQVLASALAHIGAAQLPQDVQQRLVDAVVSRIDAMGAMSGMDADVNSCATRVAVEVMSAPDVRARIESAVRARIDTQLEEIVRPAVDAACRRFAALYVEQIALKFDVRDNYGKSLSDVVLRELAAKVHR